MQWSRALDVSILISPEGLMLLPGRTADPLRRLVSILISSEELMLRDRFYRNADLGIVSILISSEELMLPEALPAVSLPRLGFNPHQLRRADATSKPMLRQDSRQRFNPHQLRRADATFALSTKDFAAPYPLLPSVSILISSEELMLQQSIFYGLHWRRVSILISSEELMLRPAFVFQNGKRRSFNPHQLRRADAT